MRRLIALLSLGCALVLNGPGAGLAQDATPAAGPVVLPPDEPAYGAPYSEWVARQLQWELSFPAAVSPATDATGERCGYGQSGPVFFLATIVIGSPQVTRTCRVPAGVALLFPLFGNSCSTVEPPPYFASNEAELLACARTRIESVNPEATIVVSLDGVAVPDIGRYRVQTPPFTIAFSPDNAFDIEPLVATSLLDSYAILFAPLPPGEHTLQFSVELPDGTLGATYHLTVAEPSVITPQP
jgi:hypothetical protein